MTWAQDVHGCQSQKGESSESGGLESKESGHTLSSDVTTGNRELDFRSVTPTMENHGTHLCFKLLNSQELVRATTSSYPDFPLGPLI